MAGLDTSAWHPGARALVEEARALEELVGEEGVEIWAQLGGLTRADTRARSRAANELCDLVYIEALRPAWPIVARCLARVASAEVPGRYLAALVLYVLATVARAHDWHRELVTPAELAGWNDEVLRTFRELVLSEIAKSRGRQTVVELWAYDDYVELAERAEALLSS